MSGAERLAQGKKLETQRKKLAKVTEKNLEHAWRLVQKFLEKVARADHLDLAQRCLATRDLHVMLLCSTNMRSLFSKSFTTCEKLRCTLESKSRICPTCGTVSSGVRKHNKHLQVHIAQQERIDAELRAAKVSARRLVFPFFLFICFSTA